MVLHVIEATHGRYGSRLYNNLAPFEYAHRKLGLDIRVHIVGYEDSEHITKSNAAICDALGIAYWQAWSDKNDRSFSVPHMYNFLLRKIDQGDFVCTTCVDHIIMPKTIVEIMKRAQEDSLLIPTAITRILMPMSEEIDFIKDPKGREFLLRYSKTEEYKNPPGAYQVASRGVWQGIHGYDERMKGLGRQDNDLLNRMKNNGTRIVKLDAKKFPIYHQFHYRNWVPWKKDKVVDIPNNDKIMKKNKSEGTFVVNDGGWGEYPWLRSAQMARGWWQ